MDDAGNYEICRLQKADISHDVVSDLNTLLSELRGRPSHLTQSYLRKIAHENYVVVARSTEAPRSIIGHACLCFIDVLQGRNVLIESVVVHSDYRRHGIGTELIQHLLIVARQSGAGNVRLTCNPARAEARRLYRSIGFAPANTTVFDYRPEQELQAAE